MSLLEATHLVMKLILSGAYLVVEVLLLIFWISTVIGICYGVCANHEILAGFSIIMFFVTPLILASYTEYLEEKDSRDGWR